MMMLNQIFKVMSLHKTGITSCRTLLAAVFCLSSLAASANSTGGAVDYSGNSAKLVNMVEFVLMYCSYAVEICYVIASLLALYSGSVVASKMMRGEEGAAKNIEMLLGSVIFIIAASVVFPAIFGWHMGVGG